MSVRFRAPANVLLRRAQIVLMLATLVPTVLMTALGIVMLAVGSGSVNLVAAVLLLAFCTTSMTGYILGSIFVSRGASLARVQHDFLSSVSHELRTPLTSIRLFIETLREGRVSDPAEREKCFNLLHQEVQRLDGLVTRLIELSRMQAGRHAFERQPLAIRDVVDDALVAFDVATLQGRTEVDVRVAEGISVVGDRAALSLAITNLLVNAWKYTPPVGRWIGLSAERAADGQVEIGVADNGPGIPWAEQRAVFEEFRRGSSVHQEGPKGSGLGLAIVKTVVEAHGGKVEIRSRPGQGAEFRIRLPGR